MENIPYQTERTAKWGDK